jgi:hypothetical protein
MAQFPDREADLKALAQNMIAGLTENPALYPTPPVTPVDLKGDLESFVTLCDEAVAAHAAAEQATATKREGRQALADAMKAVLRYAENTVNYDDAKLSLLGWGGISAPTSLQPPGQSRNLEMPRQGDAWVFLDWKKPADGGAVASYKIERRERPTGAWTLLNVAFESEAMLAGQDRTVEWEYRVIASNKAGDGPPSNTTARLES